MELTIPCDYQDCPAAFTLSFLEVHGCLVTGRVQLSVPQVGFELQSPCVFSGHAILTFARELAQLQATLSGTATLSGSAGEIQLEVTHRGRGRVALECRQEFVPDVSEIIGAHHAFDLQVRFAGVTFDQSSLPHLLRTVQAFLDERHPDVSPPEPC